ncbi:MAG TPA: hypothetical protein VJK07_04125 [Candidatus Nanoarchaeia archaeon]|nr:hypothetical protein [Candidatus Nanoarchaeia archaeon]
MVADVSAITYFAPIAAFLIVFLVAFAILHKSGLLGDSRWLNLFVSLVLAALFISVASLRLYVQTIAPWFGALLISLFFILVLMGFIGGADKTHGFLRVFFLVVAILIFLISGVVVFSDTLAPWLPGTSESFGNPVSSWLYSPQVIGAVILIVIAGAVSWALIKAK